MLRRFGLCVGLLAACQLRFDPDKEARISCDPGNDLCPKDWTCIAGTCVPNDRAVPVMALAFSQPAHGAVDVGVSQEILVAFNFDVVEGSLAERVLLGPSGGTATALTAAPTQFDNIYRFDPGTLAPSTVYTLT